MVEQRAYGRQPGLFFSLQTVYAVQPAQGFFALPEVVVGHGSDDGIGHLPALAAQQPLISGFTAFQPTKGFCRPSQAHQGIAHLSLNHRDVVVLRPEQLPHATLGRAEGL